MSVIVLLVASGVTGLAQTVPAPPGPNAPAFEVTSVKATPPDADRSMLGAQPGGRFTAIGMPVIAVFTEAYGLLPSQVVNGPRWIHTTSCEDEQAEAASNRSTVIGTDTKKDAPDAAPRSDRGPSVFTALQEQLGLRLRSTRGAVDVLVIDSIDRPNPD